MTDPKALGLGHAASLDPSIFKAIEICFCNCWAKNGKGSWATKHSRLTFILSAKKMQPFTLPYYSVDFSHEAPPTKFQFLGGYS